ncbi:uncharacterized protein B0T23DRAFT_402777 [Neurospora hispaniola]|uniref:Uncharacterized protein n=1 Tax=Neurospora hispaniola TaxID=588809 RepID=A0AAJ0MUJ8_9PEZI|nr:hypothetical protein B0T23DRAFT_402777 [Neurospora hispaniola]
MSGYYEPPQPQWPPAGGQASGWEHQTPPPPPARSGASSAVPREESAAFAYQLEEVDRAIDNLVKSGKMFGMPGGRRESFPVPGPARFYPDFGGRMGAGPGPRPHSMVDFNDARGPHQPSNLQTFYAAQRHQPSRGSNEAEQMMQAKRRLAAQRERELRNYHQEQQYNRSVLADSSSQFGAAKPDRTLSPGSGLSEEERRKLIASQRSALYGEQGFPDAGVYGEENAGPRFGLTAGQNLRGASPMAFDYNQVPPGFPPQSQIEGAQGTQSAGPHERSRANSNTSPQSNPSGGKGIFDAPIGHQANRTSASSPGGSPPRQSAPGSKPGQNTVAPIGTRPSTSNTATNPALNKGSTTSLASPLSQSYNGTANNEAGNNGSAAPASATTEGPNVGLSGWGTRSNGWGKVGNVQASVWG